MAPDVHTANMDRVHENSSCVGDKACDTVHTNKPQNGSVTERRNDDKEDETTTLS